MPRAHLLQANASRAASSHSTHGLPLFLPWLAPRLCRDNRPLTATTPTSVSTSTCHPRPRCYSTAASSPPSAPTIRLIRSPRPPRTHRPPRTPHTRASPASRAAPSPPGPSSSHTPHRSLLHQTNDPVRKLSNALEARRHRRLQLETARLRTYMARQRGVAHDKLLAQGQYRSLCRRILNLKTWGATTLDLTERQADTPDQLIQVFAALDRSAHTRLASVTRPLVIEHNRDCLDMSQSIFKSFVHNNYYQIWQEWLRISASNRRRFFPRLLIYLLDRKPGRALHFIQVLANDEAVAPHRAVPIADALGHLARLHLRGTYGPREGWDEDSKINQARFVSTFLHVYNLVLARYRVVCDQDLLYAVATLADASALKDLYDAMMQNRTFLGFDTLLHFANKFAEAGESRHALRCLEHVKAMNTSDGWKDGVNRKRMLWTCALILRKSIAGGLRYHETPTIVAALVELGVTMDLRLYNVVMHNAMDAGDYTTAFKVYNSLEASGLKPDKHTYSILLHGCTLQSNPASFHTFAEHCAEVAGQIRDPWLAAEYLHYLYVRYQDSPEVLHSLLYKNYLRFFPAAELEPIAGSGNRSLEAAIQQQRAAAATAAATKTETETETETATGTGTGTGTGAEMGTLRPPPMALYLMLQIEIKAAAAQSTQRTMDLYEKFKGHVLDNRHHTFTQLAQDPTVWNAFLFAFCKQQQYASAAGVIKEMSSDTSNAPEPNIYSWNIFMQAFFKTGQVKAAERVFALARARGVEPDQFSYGVLSRGYAKAQLVDRIGVWVAELDETEELDPDLLRALASVTDRQGVMFELEKAREAKEVAARESREKAKRDHQAWLFKLVHETPASASPAPSASRVNTSLNKAGERGIEGKSASVSSPGEITKSLPLFNPKKVFSLRTTAEAEAEARPQEAKKEDASM